MLVPPLPDQAPLKNTDCGLLNQSPLSETSGSAFALDVQKPPLIDDCHGGAAYLALHPPPVPPPLPAQLPTSPHAVCDWYTGPAASSRFVAPMASQLVFEAGNETLLCPELQSAYAPRSPDEFTSVNPWA